jgi:hypothetical protein
VAGRIEAVMNALPSDLDLIEAEPATEAQIALAHTMDHIEYVRQEGLYDIAALAAGGAIQAARLGLEALPLVPFGHLVTMPRVIVAGAFAISTTWRCAADPQEKRA